MTWATDYTPVPYLIGTEWFAHQTNAGGGQVGQAPIFAYKGSDSLYWLGDANFKAGLSGGNAIINFDSGTDQLQFDRTANAYNFKIANTVRLTVSATGINVPDNATIGSATATPSLTLGYGSSTSSSISLNRTGGANVILAFSDGWTYQNAVGYAFRAMAGATYFMIDSAAVKPGTDNAFTNGTSGLRWSTVYAATGTINTSDERTKTDIGAIPDEWLDAWEDVEWVRYRFVDAVAEKGDGARWHIGAIAQRIRDAFAEHGLDALSIGLLCHDRWDREVEPVFEMVSGTRLIEHLALVEIGRPRKDGTRRTKEKLVRIHEPFSEMQPTGESRVIVEAGERWGLRYDECLAFEAAFQRRAIKRLAAAVARLA